ncbi:DUF6232 family protein [Sulfurimonas sp.]|uniref:DUF6232 family protein n=1 Tax=Sulfurimonas sp. TaxID=2022749 RepID=UPI002AB09757|nr:DUF6232 family protein [Sulfurimonas sp.]
MECPYCKEDIKEGAIKCKHCGSMLNETELKEIKIDKEKVFCTADGIKVTSNRFIVENSTYSISNISSVKIGSESSIGIIVSIIIFIGGLFSLSFITELGIGLIILAIIIFISSSKKYTVIVSTNSGEVKALTDKNKEAIVGIVEAINKAIEYKN